MADLESVQALFDAIRESCSIAMWSRGVELVRADAIHSEGEQDGEIQLRVSTRGGLVCPSVNLRPDDEDWDCDCSSRENVCDHTAGAVIALRRAVKQGRSLDAAKSTAGRIGYRFTRSGGALHFARVIVTDGAEVPLRTTLSAITSGRVEGPSFVATRADTTAESIVAARSGALPRGLLPRLLEAIAAATDVRLDGEAVRTSSQPVGLRARVVDADELDAEVDRWVERMLEKPELALFMVKTTLRSYAQHAALGDASETDGDLIAVAARSASAAGRFAMTGKKP